jgi:hypothetical protein
MKSFVDIPVTINIAPDKKTYEEWTANKSIVFDNSLGFADLKEDQIYIKNPFYIKGSRKLVQVLLHEYIHIYIYHHWTDAPLWFHEGMAWYFSEGISFDQMLHFMTNNAFHNKLLLIKNAYSYPDKKSQIEPFYFQAALLIKHTAEEDKKRLQNLFELSANYKNFGNAFLNAFKMPLEEFLAGFYRYLNTFFKLSIYKTILLSSWIIFPILLIIAKFRQDYKTKQLLKEWEQEEINENLLKECQNEE